MMNNKKYQPCQDTPLVVNEPMGNYGVRPCAQSVCADGRNVRRVDYSTMPGIYTDEEFAEELRLSEIEGAASKEEIRDFFAKWGVAWRH